MKLSELCERLRLYQERIRDDPEVVVRVKRPNTQVGPSACVKVTGASPGFDWDRNRFFVNIEEELFTDLDELKKRSRVLEEMAGWLLLIKMGGPSDKKKPSAKDFMRFVEDQLEKLWPKE